MPVRMLGELMLTLGGRMIGGGGRSSSDTLNGWLRRSVGYSWFRGTALDGEQLAAPAVPRIPIALTRARL